MKGLPDKAFELAIVDPEYGINVAKRKHYGRRSNTKAIHSKTGKGYDVKRSDYSQKDWDAKIPDISYFMELKRVSRNQIIWGWNYFGLDWGPGLIKWNKLQPENVSFGSFEYAYCSLLDREIEFKLLWAGMMQGKSLSKPTTQQANKRLNEKRIHPTQKPVLLYKWLLLNFANPGDKIIDTHGGSMSIAVACDDLGYDLTVCELDQEYYDRGVKRYNHQTAQIKIF
jgi:site-specific DNA-methyltransferase (adenine-specific)